MADSDSCEKTTDSKSDSIAHCCAHTFGKREGQHRIRIAEILAGESLGDTIWSPGGIRGAAATLAESKKLMLLMNWLRCARKLPFGRLEPILCRICFGWFLDHVPALETEFIECHDLAPALGWLRHKSKLLRPVTDASDDYILRILVEIQPIDFDSAIARCQNHLRKLGTNPDSCPITFSSIQPPETNVSNPSVKDRSSADNGESGLPRSEDRRRNTKDADRWMFAKRYREKSAPVRWQTIWELWVGETGERIGCKSFEASCNRARSRQESSAK